MNKRGENLKPEIKAFIGRILEFSNVVAQKFPETQKKVTYIEKDVAFILAFLKDFVEECVTNKETFLQNFMQDIVPTDIDMKVNENEINLKFCFEIDEED